DARFGNVEAFPALPACAQAEIRILTIQEERIVEAAGLFEQLATVDRGGATLQESFLAAGIGGSRLTVPTLFAAAIAAQKHGGRIEGVCIFQTDLRRAHADVAAGFNRLHKCREPSRMSDGVVIQRGEKLGRPFAEALIDGRSEARIALIF